MSETITPHPGDSEERVEDDEATRHPDDTVETIEEDEAPRDPNKVADELEEQREREDDALRETEPPSAGELGIDVAGLQPKRSRLIRFVAWLDRCRQELRTLEEGRAGFLDAMGVPAVTEDRLRKLIEADTSSFLAFIRAGGGGTTKKQARAFERQKLEEQLAGDRHTAQVSRAALDQVEAEIDAKRHQIGVLEGRHKDFVLAAVVEHADTLGAIYARQVAELRGTIENLLGLGVVAGAKEGFYRSYVAPQADVKLPAFGLPALLASYPKVRVGVVRPDRPVIAVTEAEAKVAAGPWRELVAAWTADPWVVG